MHYDLEKVHELIAEIRKDTCINSIKILVGGLAYRNCPELWRIMGQVV